MIILISLLFLLFSSPVLATNPANISCQGDDCTRQNNLPLFVVTNFYPGQTTSEEMTVSNRRSEECPLSLRVVNQNFEPDILSPELTISLTSGTKLYYSGSLSHFMDLGSMSLDNLTPGETRNFHWVVSLNQNLSNQYQDQTSRFNIDVNLFCNTSDNSNNNNNNNNNPPTCNDSLPGTPTNLTATKVSATQVRLNWTHAPSPFTSYLVAYGPSSGVYLYGNPNVGSTNQYIVGSLTPGAQYCFYVRAQNGCMPGLRSNEVCINTGSTIPITTNPPAGFQEGVLGVETTAPAETTPSPEVLGTGEIAGATTNQCSKYWLPILFLIAFIINSILCLLNSNFVFRHLVPILISFALFLIDKYFLQTRCCLIFDLYCRFYWLGNIVAYVLPNLLFSPEEK
ncbi:MAG TPA: fibronectin type III domain-containing protein [Candidatus Woesebacteria bacterium]|nr:fibronectin type III domain-containing protein [Candidatus Woesebacteria bacterium]